MSGNVPGDEAGADAAERIGSRPAVLCRCVLRQIPVYDKAFLRFATQVNNFFHRLKHKPSKAPTAPRMMLAIAAHIVATLYHDLRRNGRDAP